MAKATCVKGILRRNMTSFNEIYKCWHTRWTCKDNKMMLFVTFWHCVYLFWQHYCNVVSNATALCKLFELICHCLCWNRYYCINSIPKATTTINLHTFQYVEMHLLTDASESELTTVMYPLLNTKHRVTVLLSDWLVHIFTEIITLFIHILWHRFK